MWSWLVEGRTQFRQLKRREFVTLIGAAAAWPHAVRAQQPERMRRIGVLMGWPESDPEARLQRTKPSPQPFIIEISDGPSRMQMRGCAHRG